MIVPQNSSSLEALCFDFGYLSIKNSFLVIHKGTDHIPAIIDNLNLNLQDLKMSRYDNFKVYNITIINYIYNVFINYYYIHNIVIIGILNN